MTAEYSAMISVSSISLSLSLHRQHDLPNAFLLRLPAHGLKAQLLQQTSGIPDQTVKEHCVF